MPQTVAGRGWVFKQETLISLHSGGWKFTIKVPAGQGWFPLKPSLLGSQMTDLPSVSAPHVSLPLLTRTPVHLDYGPPMWPRLNSVTFLKTLSPNTVTVGAGTSI